MRPPELRFIMTQVQYARWFKRKPFNGDLVKQLDMCMENMHKTRLECTSWIDASSATIRVRELAASEVLDHLRNCNLRFFHVKKNTAAAAKAALIKLFSFILESIQFNKTGNLPGKMRGPTAIAMRKNELKTCYAKFVCDSDKTKLPTAWFSSVRPTQPHRFLIHLLLSMGEFVDEYSLFNQPSLRHSFIHAGLLDESEVAASIDKVARNYITQQLASLPAGTATFDRYAISAHNTIKELFLNNEFHTTELPPVLYCRLTTVTEKKVLDYVTQRKTTLVEYLLAKLKDPTDGHLPTREQCMDATIESPCDWDPTNLPNITSQPEASRTEQTRLMSICKNQILQYKSGRPTCTKGVCVVGAGGVGKTTASLMMLLYAICQGLNCAITANNSERAQELASTHLASLLCMPRGNHLSPGQLAERCISSLYRKPEKLEFLRTMDYLLLDETGMISAELLLVLCLVTKYVKNTNRPNGGMLLQATLDNLQIDPCSGRHPLLSPMFVSNFIFFRLRECVRSATDKNWMRLQEITRLPPHALENSTIKEEFIELFVNNVGCIPTTAQHNLPPNSLFVYGKNEPLRGQQKKLFLKLNARCNKIHLVSTADDKERTVEGRMVPATQHTSDMLDKRIKEPRELYFYLGGRYQITANDRAGKYSNSQLTMLFEMPTQEQLDKKQPIKMLLAPPGSRYIPSDKDTLQSLIELGWTHVLVHPCCDKNVTTISKGIRATRVQYVLRHHIGSTLHSIMGQTLSKLITEVQRGGLSPYSLWLASQVVVLLSRTKTAADTIFVTTNMHETAEILYDILLQTTPFRTYISELLDKLCAPYETGEPVTVNHYNSIYQCRNAQLPLDNTGSVYLLVSLANPATVQGTYIGSTKRLAKRLNEHNTGWGSRQTASACLRPWATLAYVCGFDSDYTSMRAFEEEWIATRNSLLERQTSSLTAKRTITIVKDLLRDWQHKHPNLTLRLVECGSIQHMEEMRDR
jgi:predicted GIY-YIG superfamily endonuclease